MMVDRVGIILDGAIRRQGKLSELISRSTQYYEIVCDRIGEKELAGRSSRISPAATASSSSPWPATPTSTWWWSRSSTAAAASCPSPRSR